MRLAKHCLGTYCARCVHVRYEGAQRNTPCPNTTSLNSQHSVIQHQISATITLKTSPCKSCCIIKGMKSAGSMVTKSSHRITLALYKVLQSHTYHQAWHIHMCTALYRTWTACPWSCHLCCSLSACCLYQHTRSEQQCMLERKTRCMSIADLALFFCCIADCRQHQSAAQQQQVRKKRKGYTSRRQFNEKHYTGLPRCSRLR